ncbi:MAG: glycosyltransferase family 9 protein [Bacteroidales bacterium]|nr:glycosyltransferase family 9 protein [Bacteroidales bacterium]
MKHVLVIRLSALGDVAIMKPVVKAYADANPGVRFTVAGPPMLQPLFEGMANVSYLGLKKKQSFVRIYKALDAVGADTVVDLHKVNRVGFAVVLLRLRHLLDLHYRIFALRKGRVSRWLYLHHWRRDPRRPQWQRYDDVFRRAGLKRAESGAWRVESGRQLPTTHTPLPTKIGVAPFAQHAGKIWPEERTEALVRMLSERGCEVVLFGSKDEAPVLERWARHYRGVSSMAGRLPFAEELEVIRGLSLMVSMDSANMHFASAVGVPVVSIWGATHPDFGFYGFGQDRANALCADLPCQPCSAYGSKPCRYGDRRCMAAITPEMVLGKIEAMLKNNIVNTQ